MDIFQHRSQMHWLASFCVRVCLCVFVSENSKLENQKTMKTHISLANLCASGILEFRHDWSCFAVLNCGHCYCCRCIAIAIAVYCSPLLSYYLLRPLLLLSLHCTSVSRRRIVLYLFSHSDRPLSSHRLRKHRHRHRVLAVQELHTDIVEGGCGLETV